MAEDATSAELDAAALLFLDEYTADADDVVVADARDVALPPDDAELLSSLLASPTSSSVAFNGNPHANADGALSLATAQLQLGSSLVLPLDLFPPSDDESSSSTQTNPQINSNNKQPTTLKAKRKKPNRSPNYNPNRARNERRHELIYLKQKVAEMEQELVRLRDKTEANSIVVAQEDPSTQPPQSQLQYMNQSQLQQQCTTATDVGLNGAQDAGVWQRVATRQLTERRRAERENERLKIVLETQLKIARSLEHMLHKRTVTQGLEESGLGKQKRVFANSSIQPDDLIFEELLNQVHECYLDAENHFERMGIGATEVSCRDARIRDSNASNNPNTVDMEIFANEVLPFELHTAAKAAWQYFSIDKNHLPYRLYYERVRENKGLTEDTIIENSGLELHVNNTKAIFNLKQVLRRYVEPDRVVIAYSAIAQPVEFANKPVWGCQFREYGCMILKRPVVHDPTTHSVLKTCYFIVPEFNSNNAAEDDHRMIGDLTEFVLSSTAATMAAWLQMIENILVVDHIDAVR